MNILYADEFVKQFRKLPRSVQLHAVKQETLFRENPIHPSLNAEKLIPRNRQIWSIRVNKKYRILFRYMEKSDVYFLAIGKHDWIYKYLNRI